MEICRNSDPVSQVTDFINGINPSYYDALLIKFEPNNTPGCWGVYTPAEHCAFLTQAANTVTQLAGPGTTPGIFTTDNIWNEFVGSSCDIFSVAPIIWYATYGSNGQVDSTQSFDDFVPFGGYTVPQIKQIAGNKTVTLCNNPLWHAYIDELWTNIVT